jgi:hypothetical protein
VIKKGLQLSNGKLVNTIVYAGDQILMATSKDDLHSSMYYHHGSQVEAACGAVIFPLHGVQMHRLILVQMNTENRAQQVVIFDLVVLVCRNC